MKPSNEVSKLVAPVHEVTLNSHTLRRVLDGRTIKRLMAAAVEDGTFIQDALDICEECGVKAEVALV